MNPADYIREVLIQHRQKLGINTAEVHRRAIRAGENVSPAAISRYENEETGGTSEKMRAAYLAALDVSEEQVWREAIALWEADLKKRGRAAVRRHRPR